MNKKELRALKRVTEYLEGMEKKHYEENGKASDHIYMDVVVLKTLIEKEGICPFFKNRCLRTDCFINEEYKQCSLFLQHREEVTHKNG